MQKGDFSRDGISGLLSFAYTNSYVHYGPIAAGASGSTVLAPINNSIAQYNAYTKFCATHPSGRIPCAAAARRNGMTANACYTTTVRRWRRLPGGGCPLGEIANPYWNSPRASAGQYRRRTSRRTTRSRVRSGLPLRASAHRTSERW